MAIKNTMKQRNYGLPNALAVQFPDPIVSVSDPTVFDVGGQIGQVWVNTDTPTVSFYVGASGGQAQWISAFGGAGVFTSLTVTPGPISLQGTTSINTTGSAATTNIGTGGTGVVNIGNATGNVFNAGTLTVQSSVISVAGNLVTTNGNALINNRAVSATGPNVELRKSRAGAVITVGDVLGNVLFEGFDGTTNIVGAAIVSTSTGTIAANQVASTLSFWTHPDSAGALASRMTINSAGNVVVATPDSGVGLSISAATTAISATGGDITIGNGDLNINTPGSAINLPGPIQIITGAGAPANPLALAAGDMYINTTPTGATDRIFVATGVGAWTNVTCAA